MAAWMDYISNFHLIINFGVCNNFLSGRSKYILTLSTCISTTYHHHVTIHFSNFGPIITLVHGTPLCLVTIEYESDFILLVS